MPYKDKEKQKEWDKQWYLKNREKIKEKYKLKYSITRKKYYVKNKEKEKEYNKKWNLKNHDKLMEYWERSAKKVKNLVFSHYGKKCILCDFSDMRALSIDHINGDGAKHRRQLWGINAGKGIYRWLVKNDYPDGFRTLCMNCQFIERTKFQKWTTA